MARAGRSLGYSIRVAMYSHLQRLSLAYHDKRRTGDVLTRVTGDVLVVEDFVVKSVSNIVGSLMVLVGSFLFLLYRSWNVALVALFVVPLLAVVSNHYSRRIKTASKTQRDREGDLASTTQEMLTSIRLVQSYGRGVVDLERFSGQTEQQHAGLAGGRQHPGAVQLRHRAARGVRHLRRDLARCVAARPAGHHRRHARAVRPAAAEHVQAGPQDRQRVVQGRQGLRQRRADRRPARPGGRRQRCAGRRARPAAGGPARLPPRRLHLPRRARGRHQRGQPRSRC